MVNAACCRRRATFRSSKDDDQSPKDISMLRVCGIELKSSEAILVVVENSTGTSELIYTKPNKIKISDDEDFSEIVRRHINWNT